MMDRQREIERQSEITHRENIDIVQRLKEESIGDRGERKGKIIKGHI